MDTTPSGALGNEVLAGDAVACSGELLSATRESADERETDGAICSVAAFSWPELGVTTAGMTVFFGTSDTGKMLSIWAAAERGFSATLAVRSWLNSVSLDELEASFFCKISTASLRLEVAKAAPETPSPDNKIRGSSASSWKRKGWSERLIGLKNPRRHRHKNASKNNATH